MNLQLKILLTGLSFLQLFYFVDNLVVKQLSGSVRGHFAALSYDGVETVYVLVGFGQRFDSFEQIWKYSIVNSQFSFITGIQPVQEPSVVGDVNGDIYYIANSNSKSKPSSTLFKFSAETLQVQTVAKLGDVRVTAGFTSLVRLDDLYFLTSDSRGHSDALVKYRLDSGRSITFPLPEPMIGSTLSFCGFSVCMFGGKGLNQENPVYKFDTFYKSLEKWKLSYPVQISSNAFEIGDFVAMLNQDYDLVLVNVQRRVVKIEQIEFEKTKQFDRFSAVYVKWNRSIYIFACGRTGTGCNVFIISLYLKYSDDVTSIGETNVTNLSIPCGIVGAPSPTVTWLKDGNHVQNASVDETSNLIISSVELKHEGKYTCLATNLLGNLKREIQVTVRNATKIQNWIPKVTELTGKNIYLPCDAATDNLKIDVSWLRNWKPLDYSYGSRFQKSNLNGLWISEAEESDSGNYTCVVTTKVDSVNLTLFLIVHNETTIRFTNPDNLTGFEPFSLSVIWPMGVAIVCLLCVGILIIYCCYCRRKNASRLSDTELGEFLLGSTKSNMENLEELTNGQAYDSSYEMPLHTFEINRNTILGEGEFGIVYKGVVMREDGSSETVAFKTTKSSLNDIQQVKKQLKCLLDELKVMIYIGSHPNIIHLVGAYTNQLKEGVAYVAIEFCINGNLELLLRGSAHTEKHHTPNYINDGYFANAMLNTWSLQIAKGMEYLSAKKIIHSDLATRNVLVAADFSIRITDFGLSRRLQNYSNYVKMGGEPLPWRWMAVESLDVRSFSTESDVWSFGVTLWEIYSMGSIPYPGQSWTTDFVQNLKRGECLPKPEFASNDLYSKMRECWSIHPSQRPPFSELVQFLQEITYADANITYLDKKC